MSNDEKPKWYEKLILIRKRLGLTQIDMSKKLSVTQPTISQYESGISFPCGKARKKYLSMAIQAKVFLKLEELLRE